MDSRRWRVIVYRIESNNSDGKLRHRRRDASANQLSFCDSRWVADRPDRLSRDGNLKAGSTSHSDKRGASASRWKREDRIGMRRREEQAGRRQSPFLQRSRIGPWRDSVRVTCSRDGDVLTR